MLSINFLFCGKFFAVPSEQLELYQDEEIYGKTIEINSVESISSRDYFNINKGYILNRIWFPLKHVSSNTEQKSFAERSED